MQCFQEEVIHSELNIETINVDILVDKIVNKLLERLKILPKEFEFSLRDYLFFLIRVQIEQLEKEHE